MPHPALLDELWREQSSWSQTANRMKARIERARWSALVSVCLAALCATASAVLVEPAPALGRVLAVVAAAGSGALPVLRPRWSGQRLRDWTRARSVSEALKTDIYLWLAKAEPYRDDLNAAKLRAATDKLRIDAADLESSREGITPAGRPLPDVHDLPSYFAVRVLGQIENYYVPKAAHIAGRLALYRRLEAVLGILGLLLGVTAVAASTTLAAWVTVVTTISAALGVHVAATRYDFQLIEFSRTAERLRQLRGRALASGIHDDELNRLAAQAEEVISVENQGWMARLAEDPADHAAPNRPD